MDAIDQFSEAQRKLVVAEIARHRKEAYAQGVADAQKQTQAAIIAAWLKRAWGSWTMRGGLAAIAAALAADTWPVAAELLAGRIDPQVLAILGAAVMALRARSVGK